MCGTLKGVSTLECVVCGRVHPNPNKWVFQKWHGEMQTDWGTMEVKSAAKTTLLGKENNPPLEPAFDRPTVTSLISKERTVNENMPLPM